MREKFGIVKIGLFGSYAKEQETEESDIDIYAEFSDHKFRKIAGAWNYLEEHLGKKVDLFYPHSNVHESFINSIERETIYG